MRKIIFTRPDGGLSITTPARNTYDNERSDNYIENRAWNKLPLGAMNPKWIEESDVPIDRTFRNALEDVGGKPVHNIPKTKLLAHDMRREKREEEMKPWDDIVMKQIPGQDAALAEVERKKIRDTDAIKQTNIDNATTVEQIKNAI